jgi:hypothetical protein
MNTFIYRDLRRQRINDALAALQDAPVGLREALEREQTAIQTGDWSVADRTYLAIAEDWLWAARLSLKASVNTDPVFTALGTSTAITDEQAAAIENIPHGPSGPPPNYLAQVRAAIGNDPAILTELVHAAHHAWLEQPAAERAYPFDDVGVLLPLRLETLFDAPQSSHNDDPVRWKLLLRVVPDEASICRDNSHVSTGELNAIQTFWLAARQPGPFTPSWLDSAEAGVAWATLCHQVTPPRAAWLAANLLPQIDGDTLHIELPLNMPATPQANRVGGLPPQLRVWAITRDANNVTTRHAIGRLPMADDATISADALPLSLPDTPENTRNAWWASWDTAKAVGLGGEWLLDRGLAPTTLEAIYVIGMGEESPDAHFRAQSDAGELGVLRLGTPTNTVHGAPVANLATDAEGWQRVARARIQKQLNPNSNPASTSGINIERHVTGTSGLLPFFPGADAPDDTQDSQRLAQALWPALLGHWLTDIWEVQEDAFRVNRWAFPLRDDAIPTPDEIRAVLYRPCKDNEREPLTHNFCPEGPLMPLQIGDQPYGLLPVTALSQWQPSAGKTSEQRQQQRIEQGMAQSLSQLRVTWATAARRNGTVVGASTEQFMEFLGRDALSKRYIQRSFMPVPFWVDLYKLNAADRERFVEHARSLYGGVVNLIGRMPETLYLSNGFWRTNSLQLVQPSQTLYRKGGHRERYPLELTRFLACLLDPLRFRGELDQLDLTQIFGDRPWSIDENGGNGEWRLRSLPNSLLIRLLIHACQINVQWQRNQTGGDLALAALKAQCEAVQAISCELDRPEWNHEKRDPDTGKSVFLIKLPDERRHQLERALRATLDSAAHRIDPWITGFAWQRLKQHSVSPRHAHRLGVYGWVDGPFLGQPGPTDAGRLHTPSYNQTLAALILRDKFLSSSRSASTSESGRNPWEINISSGKVRLAEEIADEVRLGFHIYEILGRHVEHIVGTHQKVKELRTSPLYAMRTERLDPNEVCNGIEALKGLLAGDPQFPLADSQRHALQVLYEALDTYGDLLMADGVMQLISRQPERAAETMDAAAGFTRPPSFEFIRTPPSGYHLESLVMAAVPYVSVNEVVADANPIRLADPSLAAFVESQLGDRWAWTAINQDNGAQIGTITLPEMGLTPLDTLALSVEFLAEMSRRTMGLPLVYISEGHARVWSVSAADGNPLGIVSLVDLRLLPDALAALDEATLHTRIRTQLGSPVDSIVEEIVPDDLRLWIVVDEHGALLGLATVSMMGITPEEASTSDQSTLHRRIRQTLGLAQVRIDAPRQHQLAQHLVAALGNRPAAGRDMTQDPVAQQTVDADVYAEMSDRYTALHSACQILIDGLRAATDDAQRTILLRRALGWGVTSISEPADREALFAALRSATPPVSARPLAELAEITAKALQDRLSASPAPADLVSPTQISSPLPDHEQRKRDQRPDGIPTLAQAIANLASPQGKLTILACWPQATLLSNTNLDIQQNEPTLDESWLTVVAAVRSPLARLEALQLELETPLVAWSSSPSDPWQTGETNVVKENLKKRAAASALQMSLNERFVAAYGSATTWAGAKVAVGLIDSFSEAIPMPQRNTMAAFGFNAPAARAPQAILLAVPPQHRQRLDDDLVLQIVAETRELAHARTAHVEDLGELQAMTPTLWLQSSGPSRVRLEPYPLFTQE